jgi:hypothetical protein
MKTLSSLLSLLILSSFFLLSCDDDPLNPEGSNSGKISVQFEAASMDIAENADELTIVVKLSKPAMVDATLALKASNQFTAAFTTTPPVENGVINVPVQNGDESVAIKVKPVNNSVRDGNRTVDLTFENLPSQFVPGVHKTLKLTVKDDETTGPGVHSAANFIDQDITLEETNSTGVVYQIHLSNPVAIDSELKIALSSDKGIYDLHYATEPAAENNVLTLQVSAGSSVIGFKVKSVPNSNITGELIIQFLISETTGSITKGHNLDQAIRIKDDELFQKPRGYEVTAGSTIVKRFYEYDELGRVSKVKWENYTPYLTQGNDIYHYDASNFLVKINKSPGRDIVYHWSNGRITKSETIVDGNATSYTDYEYDAHGNIAGVASYHRQDGGSFKRGMFTIYFYLLDGNIYKSLTYEGSDDPNEPTLISTKTYDNYIDVANPFPMTEILPVVKSQTKLATTYRVEENGRDHTYHMTYEYRPDFFYQIGKVML